MMPAGPFQILIFVSVNLFFTTISWASWAKIDRAKSTAKISFHVELKQRNLQQMEELFWSVSDPKSDIFRKYLTKEEITSMISPSGDDIESVSTWLGCPKLLSFNEKLRDGDISCHKTAHGDYIYVHSTVSKVESMFGIELYDHEFVDTSVKYPHLVRAAMSSDGLIPIHLRGIVDRIMGLTELPPQELLARSNRFNVGKEPGDKISPDIIWRTYGIDEILPLAETAKQGNMSCAEFQDEEFLQTDLTKFESYHGLPPVQATVVGHNPTKNGYFGEGSLDTEYLVGTAPGIDLTWWGITWGSSFTNDVFQWSQQVVNADSPPLVHEVSWGIGETGSASYDITTLQKTNTNFQIMGLMGLTILVSSGDSGTSALNGLCKKFDPTYPASSPYVTAVGGTYLLDGVEVGWGSSGGGFSNVWPRPSYQDKAITAYLARDGLPADSLFNASGRAIPDISAFATNFQAIANGANYTVSGTSASAPVVGGIMALLNSVLLTKSKPPLGFVNPALYELFADSGPGFDVTEGNNVHKPCAEGFPATPGWDAITGLGTPHWSRMVDLVNIKAKAV